MACCAPDSVTVQGITLSDSRRLCITIIVRLRSHDMLWSPCCIDIIWSCISHLTYYGSNDVEQCFIKQKGELSDKFMDVT